MPRRFAVLCVLAVSMAALAAPPAHAQTTEQCLADHTGDAPVVLRGRLAAERTIHRNRSAQRGGGRDGLLRRARRASPT